jgi:hypothetical protein
MDRKDDDDESRTRYNTMKIENDILIDARYHQTLLKSAAGDWEKWKGVIIGWQALKLKAIATCGTSDVQSDAYKKAMTKLMQRDPYSEYGHINKATRSAMTRMMDHIEEIDRWHTKLSSKEMLNWNNPQTIVKHCPKEFLTNPQHNLPPKNKKKKEGGGSSDRYRKILLEIIKETEETNPERANKYKEKLNKADLNEDLGGLEHLAKSEKRNGFVGRSKEKVGIDGET